MHAKNMQIGDSFRHNGKTVRIVGIIGSTAVILGKDSKRQTVLLAELEPIALTDEILLEIGFAPHGDKGCFVLDDGAFRAKLFCDDDGKLLVISYRENSLELDHTDNLHELQQAFRIINAPGITF